MEKMMASTETPPVPVTDQVAFAEAVKLMPEAVTALSKIVEAMLRISYAVMDCLRRLLAAWPSCLSFSMTSLRLKSTSSLKN